MKPDYRIPTMSEVSALKWNGLNVVSTFSGCGGSCLGFRMAGYRSMWASEFIPAAAKTYSLNHPDTTLDTRDIRKVQPEDILKHVPSGESVHVMEGSPPCAAFSMAGKRTKAWGQVKTYSDTKQRVDDLFSEFLRLVAGVQPNVFVMENVKGLIGGASSGVLKDTLETMRAIGYRVEARLLDAQWLGVPQHRERVIFQGVRLDLNKSPAWPKPFPYRYSIRDVIPDDVMKNSYGPPFRTMKANSTFFPASYNGNVFLDGDQSDVSVDDKSSVVYVAGIGHANFAMKGHPISLDAPVPTILAHLDTIEKHIRRGWVTTRHRVSLEELRILCSFPSDFLLPGDAFAKQWERLGRAVPPLMMRAIAASIRDKIFQHV